MPDDAAAHAAMGPRRPTVAFHVLTAIWAVLAAVMSASIAGAGLMLPLAVVLFGGTLGIEPPYVADWQVDGETAE